MTLAISPAHCGLLLGLRRADPPRRVVVIGAAALGHHIPLARTTADVDLVIVADAAETNALLGSLGWKRDQQHRQRWRDGLANIVDALPATAEVIESGEIALDGRERVMSTVGFDLVLDHSSPVAIPASDARVDVASLATIAVLKMVAWLDRPHERRKDLSDLGAIFHAALDEWDDRRWEPPLADLEHELQSASFIGREVARIARAHHRTKLEEFFEKIDEEAWSSAIGAGGLVCSDPEAVALRRLAAFRETLQ